MNQENNSSPGTFSRVARFTSVKFISLFLTVVVAVYLTIIIANLGGYVDEIIKGRIDTTLLGMVMGGWLDDVPEDQKAAIVDQTTEEMREAAGLNSPFLLRSLRWLWDGITMDWGQPTGNWTAFSTTLTPDVRILIRDRLPRSLLIFGTGTLLLFFVSLFLALGLSRKYGGWQEKVVLALSPLSAVPAWTYGILLTLIFLKSFGGFSSGGTLDAWPDEFSLAYLPIFLKHMLLPTLSIFLSGIFLSIYTWRTFFLLYSNEDYVEIAKAKGLPSRMIERRYILRPGLPTVLTSFALLSILLWQEIIALERFFNVEGIGRLFYGAIRAFDTPVILGLVTTFAYLLAITVFLLDIAYAIVDPRVKVENSKPVFRTTASRKGWNWRFWKKRDRSPIPQPFALNLGGNPEKAPKTTFSSKVKSIWRGIRAKRNVLHEVFQNPAAIIGTLIISGLLAISIYTVITLPYQKAITLWRGDHDIWLQNPAKAQPEWTNLFRKDDLPVTMVLSTRDGTATKTVSAVSEEMTEIAVPFRFDYHYGGFPQELAVRTEAQFEQKRPLLTFTWITPDERELDLGSISLSKSDTYYFSQDDRLQRKFDGRPAQEAVFTSPEGDGTLPVKGRHTLLVKAFVFEQDADVDAEFTLYGQVHGLAGTDNRRRDLTVALMWGTPIALAFGVLAALATTISSVLIAGVSVWYGGWVDSLLQRITEVNMVLPFLPVAIMVFTLYSRSFWVILGVVVILSIFGTAIKNYRAIFLQVKQDGYIEAAQAYGASDRRIIFRYMLPRIGTYLLPQMLILIPAYVFLEATLAFLGVSDPDLPTWGKVIVDALEYGIYSGDYYWVLEPLGLLLITAFAFLLLGYAMERVFDPRLKDQ